MILDKYQLSYTLCAFLGDIGITTIASELGIKSYQVKKRSDVVDTLKSYISNNTSICGRGFC